jgi:hypothetical protein
LLEIGWADLRKNQAHFKEVAKELEPDKTPSAVLEELGEKSSRARSLLDAFRATFDGLVSFIRAHHIVTIPSDVRPIVEETPPSCAPPPLPAWTRRGRLRRTRPRLTST